MVSTSISKQYRLPDGACFRPPAGILLTNRRARAASAPRASPAYGGTRCAVASAEPGRRATCPRGRGPRCSATALPRRPWARSYNAGRRRGSTSPRYPALANRCPARHPSVGRACRPATPGSRASATWRAVGRPGCPRWLACQPSGFVIMWMRPSTSSQRSSSRCVSRNRSNSAVETGWSSGRTKARDIGESVTGPGMVSASATARQRLVRLVVAAREAGGGLRGTPRGPRHDRN